MAYTGVSGHQADPSGTKAVFNPPPGWPAPPAGWEPPPGWQPDPRWPAPPPGWQFWLPPRGPNGPQPGPAAPGMAGPGMAGPGMAGPGMAGPGPAGTAAGAGQLSVTFDGNRHVFTPGQTVRIGRGTDNEIVVGYSSVSRSHARLSWTPGGWMFENLGQAPTFIGGQPVARFTVTQPVDLTLGSAHGPVLRVEPAAGTQGTAWPGQGAMPGFGPQYAGAPGTQFGPGPGGWPAGPPQAPDDFGAALQILIPVKNWMHNPGWHQGLRLLVITYALLPLVFIALFLSSSNLSTPGWAYALYVAPLWALGFWWLIRPGPIRKLEMVVGACIIVWTFLWLNVVTVNINDAIVKPNQNLSILAAIAVGFNEEITKALPVFLAGMILLYWQKTKLDARMWMWLGTVAGLTFGVAEAALYTSQYLSIINSPNGAGGAVPVVLLFAERVFVDGFQHALWAGISGFFIGMGLNYPRRRFLLIALGVTMAALLHALNDWGLGAFGIWAGIGVQALSLFLFLGYTMSASAIQRQVRRTPMFRGESMVMDAFTDTHGTTGSP
jgi:RsiW-degrading membrane proteinase PrsW (M82 family)